MKLPEIEEDDMNHSLKIERQALDQGIESIRGYLIEAKIAKSEITRNLLAIEDILACMFEHSDQDTVRVHLYSFLGNVKLHMTIKGDSFSMEDVNKDFETEEDPEIKAVLEHYMAKVLNENIELSHRRRVNHCRIHIAKSRYANLIRILTGLFLGLLCGQSMKMFLPAFMVDFTLNHIFVPISTMFINALKMLVAPLVFFSMASSIADITDIRALGKIALKTVSGYLITSVVACTIGLVAYTLFPIGDPSLLNMLSDKASSMVDSGKVMSTSITEIIVNIIPKDFISPFLNSDMLQIIFMGILLGIAIAALATRYPFAKEATNCLNAIFGKITSMIVRFMPIAIFCSMAKMIIGMNFASLTKILIWVPVCYFGYLCMFLIFFALLLANGLSPLKFVKGYFPAMIAAFSIGSSNAAMPAGLKACDEKLGISKTIYSFSIPLGSTINMNGSCIYLIISILFMAKIFGVTFNSSMIITLVISATALSMGAPGVPGSGLICLSMLLPQFGMPAEGISIVMGIYTLVSMGLACTNVTGDAVIAMLTAKSEKQLNYDIFNAN